jgi:hypothetical protein
MNLFLAFGAFECKYLPVSVSGLYFISIHDGEPANTSPAKHLGGPGANATQASHQHMGLMQFGQRFIAKHQPGSFLPVCFHFCKKLRLKNIVF